VTVLMTKRAPVPVVTDPHRCAGLIRAWTAQARSPRPISLPRARLRLYFALPPPPSLLTIPGHLHSPSSPSKPGKRFAVITSSSSTEFWPEPLANDAGKRHSLSRCLLPHGSFSTTMLRPPPTGLQLPGASSEYHVPPRLLLHRR
jgi:hypothetical protein